MMEYKGYVAAVEFDDSIDVFQGRVVNSGAIRRAVGTRVGDSQRRTAVG